MSFTKRQIVEAAYGELALAAYTFDLSPDEIQAGLQRIEGMLRTWKNQGIDTGYVFPVSPAVSDPDDSSGMLDFYEEAVRTNGAIRIAPLFGKTVSSETRLAARLAYQGMLVGRPVPVMQLPRNLPVGAGNRWGGAGPGYFAPCLPAGVSDPSVSSTCSCGGATCCSKCIDEVTKILMATSGAGLVGFSTDDEYPDDTVGAYLIALSGRFANLGINVKDAPFNAKGDGSDDFQAIQEAIYAGAGGDVYFPSTQFGYGISKTLIVPAGTTLIFPGTYDAWEPTGGRGVSINTIGAGNPQRWTDIDGSDAADFTPMIVFAGNGCNIVGGVALITNSGWSCGLFVPAVKQCGFDGLVTLGNFSKAGIYLDATWSDRNITLKALHPEISSSSMNEFKGFRGFLKGASSIRLQGTTRNPDLYTDEQWLWSWGGTSDIVIDACELRPNSGAGACVWLDAAIKNASKTGQGIWFNNCAYRAGSSVNMFYLDRINRVVFSGYGEASSTVRADLTSRTGDITFRGRYINNILYLDGEALAGGIDSGNQGLLNVTVELDNGRRDNGKLSQTDTAFSPTEDSAASLGASDKNFNIVRTKSVRNDTGVLNHRGQTGVSISAGNASNRVLVDTTSARFSPNGVDQRLLIDDTVVASTCPIRSTRDNTDSNGTSNFRWATTYTTILRLGDGTTLETSGNGSPEGVISANVGSRYWRNDGAAGTFLYRKNSGASTTGWVAIL